MQGTVIATVNIQVQGECSTTVYYQLIAHVQAKLDALSVNAVVIKGESCTVSATCNARQAVILGGSTMILINGYFVASHSPPEGSNPMRDPLGCPTMGA